MLFPLFRSKRVSIIILMPMFLGGILVTQPQRTWSGNPPSTQEVFAQHKDQIVRIHVLESSSGSKSVVGSGFIVSSQGHIVTNYHVIAELIHKPGQYHGQILYTNDHSSPFTVLNFDAIHDLAIVQSKMDSPRYFRFSTEPLQKGMRVYSMGNPYDLGVTIVEGTHSGLLTNSLYDKIHFTGSLNSGMSGGPAITSREKIMGVNVQSLGNQVGFLVPAIYAQTLLEETLGTNDLEMDDPLLKLRDQLLVHQDSYLAQLMSDSWPTCTLGPFHMPGKMAAFVKCSGSSEQEKENLYESVTQTCSIEDNIFISDSHSSGTLNFTHEYLSTNQLNQLRFFSIYQAFFGEDREEFEGDKEDVGSFRCISDFVDNQSGTLKVVFCLRGYKKLPGLYDMVLKAATLGHRNKGMHTSFRVIGISYENAVLFSQIYLGRIAWDN